MTIKKDEDDFAVYSKTDGEYLGLISFNNDWKKWTFSPDIATFYDRKCLIDIIDWLKDIEDGKLKV
jgi:hypothetical protein